MTISNGDASRNSPTIQIQLSNRFDVGWPKGLVERFAAGIDSTQALVFALQMVGAEFMRVNITKRAISSGWSPARVTDFPYRTVFAMSLLATTPDMADETAPALLAAAALQRDWALTQQSVFLKRWMAGSSPAMMYRLLVARASVIASSASDEAIQFFQKLDCFAEPVIGPRFARTCWLTMTSAPHPLRFREATSPRKRGEVRRLNTCNGRP